MLNAAITLITTYVMCTIRLPRGVIDNIDRIRKQFLWRGNSEKKKGRQFSSLGNNSETKRERGSGCSQPKLQNDALLLKHLHKFYNRDPLP
jgi:hypothetical protein